MSTNPWLAGVFFEQFVSEQAEFIFRDPLRDQRQCLLLEIQSQEQISLLPFGTGLGTTYNHNLFWIDDSGVPQFFSTIRSNTFQPPFFPHPTLPNKIWRPFIGPPFPVYYIFTDENNVFHYLISRSTNPNVSPNELVPLESLTGGILGDDVTLLSAKGVFVGPYIDLLCENSQDTYRLSIDTDNNLNIDLVNTDTRLSSPVTVSNGHPFAILNQALYIESLISLGDVDIQIPTFAHTVSDDQNIRTSTSQTSFGGIADPKVGIIRISIHDSDLDYLCHQDFDGRTFIIRKGATDQPTHLYPVIIRGTIQDHEFVENELLLTVGDYGNLLDRDIQEHMYLGTGGYEGDTELQGEFVPLLYGRPSIIPPLLINRNLNLYQIHDGPIERVGDVYVGGIFVINLGDFPDTLLTWQPTQSELGGLRTDLARGLFRLAAPPTHPVVSHSPRGTTAVPTNPLVGRIIRHIIETRIPEITIDTNSFDEIELRNPSSISLYVTERKSIKEVINPLVASLMSVFYLNTLNRAYIKQLSMGDPIAMINDADIIDGTFKRSSPPLPGKSYRLGYQKSYSVLTESDFAGQASLPIKSRTRREYLYATYEIHPTMTGRFISTSTKTINTDFVNLSGAVGMSEIFALNEYMNTDIISVDLFDYSWKLSLGDTVMLEFPRWGLAVPRPFIVMGVTERSPTGNTENITTLKLWGALG